MGVSSFYILFLLNPTNDGLRQLYFFTRILQYMYECKHAPLCSINAEELLSFKEALSLMNSDDYEAELTNIKQQKKDFDENKRCVRGPNLKWPGILSGQTHLQRSHN